jgi:hypothetical protein
LLRWCHALIHLGLLKVSGTITGGLVWTRVSDGIGADEGEIDREAAERDEKAVEEEIAAVRAGTKKAGEESTTVDASSAVTPAAASVDAQNGAVGTNSPAPAVDIDLGLEILKGAGYKKADALARIEQAIEILRKSGKKYVQDQVFRLALSLGFGRPQMA